ncbi:MAG: amino acid ABC transporter permease [Alphaproteobacteria bacterium]|nr:amino acid ABC transporter permease [Alphaproteobacteria bacterium]
MSYNWNWGVLVSEPYLGWLISGTQWTLAIACLAWIMAFTLGSLIGIARTTPIGPLRWLGTAYVELFRNIPLLVQMFLWFFVFPEVLPRDWGRWVKRDLPMPEFTTAVLCLGFYTASRVAEQVRSGLNAVPKGLLAAGQAGGLTLPQIYRYILLPLGFRIIVPSLTSDFLAVFKNSSLALTIGVMELTAQSRQIENYTFQGFEAFTAATVIYCVITAIVVVIMTRVEARLRVPGLLGRQQGAL